MTSTWSNSQGREPDGGLSHGHRHFLSLLSARAGTSPEREIGPDPVERLKCSKPVTGNGEGTQGRSETPRFNKASQPGAKNKFTCRRIDSSPVKPFYVDSPGSFFHDLLRVSARGHQEGVGHSGQGEVAERLPATVAGCSPPQAFPRHPIGQEGS